MLSRLSLKATPRIRPIAVRTIYDMASVTYSGGHPAQGQGGFYGAAGARTAISPEFLAHRPEMLAMEADVQRIKEVMEEVDLLSHIAEDEEKMEKRIELKFTIQKLVTNRPFLDCLARLECAKGQPIWGLSMDERDLVSEARRAVTSA
mmetsp:Transcript_45329/g.67336  ORF Transcript_45329/g.67336 Transcript_45329/m.67336 type:complete len:148 (-) Transcript_45329:190-633(-)|eukprot:CAMPEP_0194070308 /NCGR_PEP_ID=MMETSP0009_2-20130614/88110_1 /TAXON_ID=210454 /ORGANISM="Grammatophora oceanica, Strain CCMP 410" /LENGTH=147 /DNA_ID=CAMNT_0038723571 /DNA_START=1211 /DNA_END=1654 /DNA_ORIENTATION=+